MSVDNCSNRDFVSSAILASSTFALRNCVVLASGLPSLYLVAGVDVCDIPSLPIHHTNGLGSISYLKRLECSSFLPCRAICCFCKWLWPDLQNMTTTHVFIHTGWSFVRINVCGYCLSLTIRGQVVGSSLNKTRYWNLEEGSTMKTLAPCRPALNIQASDYSLRGNLHIRMRDQRTLAHKNIQCSICPQSINA